MPTGFENAGRGRGQGRRPRRRGSFGRRVPARNRDIRSQQSNDAMSDDVDNTASSSVNGATSSRTARQTFMSIESNRARVLREL